MDCICALETELKSYKEAPLEPTVVDEAYRSGQDAAFLRIALMLEAQGHYDLAQLVRLMDADKFPERM